MSQVELFGKYILLEKLAAGGMAEVYLAKSTGANGVSKFLAIKRILPQFSENREFIEMFKEEAKIAVNLNHSNVVSIFDFGIEKNQFFLVMEHVEGRNLRQIINELKKNCLHFSIEQTVYMMKDVAAGLDHAHRCLDGSTGRPLNITHRDMSPQNIMLSFEGEVKIIDFGIAKAETQIENTKAGTLKGKFGYMSPEQAEGQSVDLRTDIFSLGIVLWELLASDRLFTASSEAAILRKIKDCQIPSIRKINPAIPPELERIVNKALQRDKGLRYQTAAAMHRDLNRFLNTQYPEFTPHDFSVFIKNTFINAFQDQKRKLVEFAKIKAADLHVNNQNTRTLTTNDNTVNDEAPDNLASPSMENPINAQASRISLNELKMEGTQKPVNRFNSRIDTVSRSAMPVSRPQSRPAEIPWDKVVSGFFLLIVVVTLGFGYQYFSKNGSPQFLKVSYWKEKFDPKAKEATSGGIEAASKIEHFATVYSDPAGAEISINGKSTGQSTPAQIRVEGNKPFHITLTKEQFLTYEQGLTVDRDGFTHRATLQPLPKAGYVSINLVQGGENPVIEVNGQRLGEKPPIVNYKVPAGVPVMIRVRNPFAGTSAEKLVTVGDNQKANVELILKKTEPSPEKKPTPVPDKKTRK